MKTAMLTSVKTIEIRDIPEPEISKDDDVRLKVDAVGICGSDVHYYVSGGIGSVKVDFPLVGGHEASGTVLEVGSGVSDLKPGDRVAIEPSRSCGKCDQCEFGRPNTCRDLKFMSCPGELDGCLAEQVVIPAHSCFKVPDGVTQEQAAVSEPLSVSLYSVKRAGGLRGKSVVVLGSGPIGLTMMLAARADGVASLYATDRIDARVEAARNAGVDWAGNPDSDDVVGEVLGREPLQLDVVFECCGQQAALDNAVDMLKPGGKLMIVGIPEEDTIRFSAEKIRRREITIYYIRRQIEMVLPALQALADGSINVDSLVTHRFPLEQAGAAYELVAEYGDGVIKAMVVV